MVALLVHAEHRNVLRYLRVSTDFPSKISYEGVQQDLTLLIERIHRKVTAEDPGQRSEDDESGPGEVDQERVRMLRELLRWEMLARRRTFPHESRQK